MGSNNPPRNNKAVAIPANGQGNSGQPAQGIPNQLALSAGNNNPQNAQTDLSAASSLSSVDRRQPKNLQSLLKFAMEATQAEDAPGNRVAPLDDQRRQFLEDALRSLTVNVAEVLDNAIKVLTNRELLNSIKAGDELPDEVKNSFTILLDYVDDMDVANDFSKMGGFAVFPMCYSSENEDLRARASSVLGTLCQNNPYCQERALNSGLLAVLLSLVQTERGTALTKCLYALSCMSRGYEPASLELIRQGGCPVLVELLNSSEPAAKTKAAFLVRHFCQNYPDARKRFVTLNIVKVIAAEIKAGRNESTEHLLSILQVLVSTKDQVILRLCRDPKYNLRQTLQDHLRRPELRDDRFLEEKEYCQELLNTIYSGPPVNEEPADR
ncbi:hypothetical protein PYW07_008482 [Mythimna separata]|uniref:Nucleotide exchange factor Fes1 domain-containing protein n=1 Tax=Mythimna separata TaxID=271217 RepID=A0AAD8DMX2_MYTSE|nr:hypothetical protein PYW07_008482 [Mythimna separata]